MTTKPRNEARFYLALSYLALAGLFFGIAIYFRLPANVLPGVIFVIVGTLHLRDHYRK